MTSSVLFTLGIIGLLLLVYWNAVSINLLAFPLVLIILKLAKKTRATIRSWRKFYDIFPIDFRLGLFVISGLFTWLALLLLVNEVFYFAGYTGFPMALVASIILFSIGMAITVIQGIYFMTTIKESFKHYTTNKDWEYVRDLWRNSIIVKLFLILKTMFSKLSRRVHEAFLDRTTGTQVFVLAGMVFALGFAAVITVIHPIFIFLYLLLLGVVGIPMGMIILNKIGYFNRIVDNTNELAAGNLGQDIELTGKSALTTLAKNINLLKHGVKVSQTEQAKSERMKTELITNVSHDLRTPLTSIITYTELLKKEHISHEERTGYIEIIDRKSKRLKVLIDDLFEVSKMASGTMELRKEKVDLVQLLQQALAEYDDVIQDSSLQFRISSDDPPVNAVVDGQKLWRVFDNLIANILKYSLENSRVYIDLKAENGTAFITFKNVSKYELSENSDELFERFKRGDTSRHTEGSGLGLAIAQSIVELHGGSLDIETDGDLFKVTIMLNI